MKINVNNKSLTQCLEVVSRALPQKVTLPINSFLLFSIKDKVCEIYAQNGKLQIKGRIAVDMKEEVKICIPGNIFMNTIRLLNDEELTLDYNEEKLSLQIIAGKKKYKMTCEDPKHYTVQKVEDSNVEFKFPAADLVRYVGTLSKIVKWDDMRPEIAGVTMVSNNGTIDITGTYESFYFYRADTRIDIAEKVAIVMHKDISIAVGSMKGNGDSIINIGAKSMSVNIDGFVFTSVLVDVRSPIILEKYFVYEEDKYIIANKQDLMMSIKRASNYAGISSLVVMSLLGKELKINSENSEYGIDAEETIDVENKNTEDIDIAVNLKFIGSILSNITGEFVKIYISAKNKPIYIRDCDNLNSPEYWGCMLFYIPEK